MIAINEKFSLKNFISREMLKQSKLCWFPIGMADFLSKVDNQFKLIIAGVETSIKFRLIQTGVRHSNNIVNN